MLRTPPCERDILLTPNAPSPRPRPREEDGPALHQLLLQIAFLEHDPQATQREIAWAGGHPELWLSLEIQAILAADLGKEQESESLFHRTLLDAIKEGQPALIDSMMLDEAGVEVDLGQMTKARSFSHKSKTTEASLGSACYQSRIDNRSGQLLQAAQ